jgi:hypothetical protein
MAGGGDRELTTEKLRLEVEKLRLDVAAGRGARQWLVLAGGAVALVASGWGLYEGASTFLEQRQRRFEFEVSQEMITLANQLGAQDPVERANAALLLSSFEEQAVPVLVSSLRRTDHPDLRRHLVESLRLILAKERVRHEPGIVLGPLAREARSVFAEERLQPVPSAERMVNLVIALRDLGSAAGGDGRQTAAAELVHLSADLEDPGWRLDELDRQAVEGWLEEARTSVGGGAGEGGSP